MQDMMNPIDGKIKADIAKEEKEKLLIEEKQIHDNVRVAEKNMRLDGYGDDEIKKTINQAKTFTSKDASNYHDLWIRNNTTIAVMAESMVALGSANTATFFTDTVFKTYNDMQLLMKTDVEKHAMIKRELEKNKTWNDSTSGDALGEVFQSVDKFFENLYSHSTIGTDMDFHTQTDEETGIDNYSVEGKILSSLSTATDADEELKDTISMNMTMDSNGFDEVKQNDADHPVSGVIGSLVGMIIGIKSMNKGLKLQGNRLASGFTSTKIGASLTARALSMTNNSIKWAKGISKFKPVTAVLASNNKIISVSRNVIGAGSKVVAKSTYDAPGWAKEFAVYEALKEYSSLYGNSNMDSAGAMLAHSATTGGVVLASNGLAYAYAPRLLGQLYYSKIAKSSFLKSGMMEAVKSFDKMTNKQKIGDFILDKAVKGATGAGAGAMDSVMLQSYEIFGTGERKDYDWSDVSHTAVMMGALGSLGMFNSEFKLGARDVLEKSIKGVGKFKTGWEVKLGDLVTPNMSAREIMLVNDNIRAYGSCLEMLDSHLAQVDSMVAHIQPKGLLNRYPQGKKGGIVNQDLTIGRMIPLSFKGEAVEGAKHPSKLLNRPREWYDATHQMYHTESIINSAYVDEWTRGVQKELEAGRNLDPETMFKVAYGIQYRLYNRIFKTTIARKFEPLKKFELDRISLYYELQNAEQLAREVKMSTSTQFLTDRYSRINLDTLSVVGKEWKGKDGTINRTTRKIHEVVEERDVVKGVIDNTENSLKDKTIVMNRNEGTGVRDFYAPKDQTNYQRRLGEIDYYFNSYLNSVTPQIEKKGLYVGNKALLDKIIDKNMQNFDLMFKDRMLSKEIAQEEGYALMADTETFWTDFLNQDYKTGIVRGKNSKLLAGEGGEVIKEEVRVDMLKPKNPPKIKEVK